MTKLSELKGKELHRYVEQQAKKVEQERQEQLTRIRRGLTLLPPTEPTEPETLHCARHGLDFEGKCLECQREIVLAYRESQLQNAGLLDGPLARMSFETFEPHNSQQALALAAAQQFVRDFAPYNGKALWLWGPNGIGKTHLACSIQRALLGRCAMVMLRLWPDLLAKIRATYGGNGNELGILRTYEQPDLVIFDDVGREHSPVKDDGRSWAQSIAFRLIDSRWRKGKPIVLTTNDSPDIFRQKQGDAVFSRLCGMAGKPIALIGPDYRLRDCH